ncbi:MAG: LysE/ArgO family amino acid transporter [Propionibacteriaceae bacterium]|jgi:L-lysine exporter family protein LysE/ArgO|nr:LysE/ArgO family amino acid transporter [Propionibacteriaceae bacterium]
MIPAIIVAGLGAGLSLIVAIGAQNAFVLRQGLQERYVAWVVAICALSDIALISAGTAGLEQVSKAITWAVPAMTWLGFCFLIAYGVLSLFRALKGESLDKEEATTPRGLGEAILTCLALTWLNPHVYLDTVLLLGSLAISHRPHQWWFTLGAMVASCLWFIALGYGARWLRPLFSSQKAWRILDLIIAIIMFAIAISLVI